MSELIDLINELNKTIKVSTESYVYYDEVSGAVKKISSRLVSDESCKVLAVPHESVRELLEGTKKTENFVVSYDVSLKQVALKEVTYDTTLDIVGNKLYRLPTIKSFVNEETGIRNQDIFEEIYDGVTVFLWAPGDIYIPGNMIWYNGSVYKVNEEFDDLEFPETKVTLYLGNVLLTNIKTLASQLEYKTTKKQVYPGIFIDVWYDNLGHLKGQHVYYNKTVYRMKKDQPKDTEFNLDNVELVCENVKLKNDKNTFLKFDKKILDGDIYLDNNKLFIFNREKSNFESSAKAVIFYTNQDTALVYDTSKKSTTKIFLEEENEEMLLGMETVNLSFEIKELSNIRKGQTVLIGKKLYLYFPDNHEKDINIVQNKISQAWEVYLSHSLKRSLELTNYRANETLYFSITSKYDPNILYRTIYFSLNDLIAGRLPNFKFKYDFEFNDTDVSIYTPKYFDTYLHEIVE